MRPNHRIEDLLRRLQKRGRVIKIHHHKQPTFFMSVYKPKMSEYHHVADAHTESLDEAFLWTNTVHEPWYEDPDRVEFRGSPEHGMAGCRSTSIGDILERDGCFYEVRPVGFARIEVWKSDNE